MKRFFSLALLMPVLLISCSDSKDNNNGVDETRGTIVLTSKLSMDVDTKDVQTRATVDDLTVILDGPQSLTVPYPESGEIGDLPVGEYTLTLTTHPDGYAPAFAEPVYEATTNVTVNKGESTPVVITCTQKNAGIVFEYDPSLSEVGYENVIPTVVQADSQLVFEGENRDAIGYFVPGQVSVSFTVDGETIPVEGNAAMVMTLAEKELWKVTISVNSSRSSMPVIVLEPVRL